MEKRKGNHYYDDRSKVMSNQIPTRFNNSDYELIKKYCKENNINLSSFIRNLVINYIKGRM